MTLLGQNGKRLHLKKLSVRAQPFLKTSNGAIILLDGTNKDEWIEVAHKTTKFLNTDGKAIVSKKSLMIINST